MQKQVFDGIIARRRLGCTWRTTCRSAPSPVLCLTNCWGGRDMLQVLREQAQGWPLENASARERWLVSIGLAFAIGVAYFLAARLSLFLQTQPAGVAVFWPAAGVSSGILIALGRDVRWPVAVVRWSVAVGVIAATIIANLTSDRTISASGAFALCNAGEALLVAWLIKRYVDRDFPLARIRHVVVFLGATIVA